MIKPDIDASLRYPACRLERRLVYYYALVHVHSLIIIIIIIRIRISDGQLTQNN